MSRILKNEWCEKQEVEYRGWQKGMVKTPRYVRCPTCNKRLKPFVHNCEDFDHIDVALQTVSQKEKLRCIHIYVPRHKSKK